MANYIDKIVKDGEEYEIKGNLKVHTAILRNSEGKESDIDWTSDAPDLSETHFLFKYKYDENDEEYEEVLAILSFAGYNTINFGFLARGNFYGFGMISLSKVGWKLSYIWFNEYNPE